MGTHHIGLSSGSRLRTDKTLWRTVLQPQEVTVGDLEEDLVIVVGEAVAEAADVEAEEVGEAEARKRRTGFLLPNWAVW